MALNPISTESTDHGLNQPIYSYNVTQAGRNRVNYRFSRYNYMLASTS